MPYLWTIVMDVAILLAMNQYRVICLILHVLLTLFVVLTTLITSFPLYIMFNNLETERDKYYTNRHASIGFIILIISFIQVILGIVSIVCRLSKKAAHPYIIYFMNVFHKYLGYPLVILGKVETYLKLYPKNQTIFWIVLGI